MGEAAGSAAEAYRQVAGQTSRIDDQGIVPSARDRDGSGLGDRVGLDVQPEDGEVILSLHYHDGLTVSPSRVKAEREERELDPRDPIPLVRLRVDAPVARVTLSWER